MKRTLLKVLVALATLILIGLGVFIGNYILRKEAEKTDVLETSETDYIEQTTQISSQKETAPADYGELVSFNYGISGGVDGRSEGYQIIKDGDTYILTASIHDRAVTGKDSEYNVTGEITQDAVYTLRDIIIEQDLFSRNGVNIQTETLYDAFAEQAKIEFENVTIKFFIYDYAVFRNDAICDYLYGLTKDFD